MSELTDRRIADLETERDALRGFCERKDKRIAELEAQLAGAAQAERATIVAWLRERLAELREVGNMYGYNAIENAADAIERGDHHG